MNISCLEELQMKLDLCLSRDERLGILETVGKIIMPDKWFVVTDDGQCYLFDNDGKLDDISKITEMCELYIRKDIKRICIPDSVISINVWTFYNCNNLTHVTIPDSVTSIGNGTFAFCSGLTSVTIPDSVTSIGESAFNSCIGLESVTVPENITNIGDYVFYNCSSLASVTIPDSVTIIGDKAFKRCTRLTSITFKGKTLKQVKAMNCFPWGIKDEHLIYVE